MLKGEPATGSRASPNAVHGPDKTLYDRFARRSGMGIFAQTSCALAQPGVQGETLMRDSPFLKAHRSRSAKVRGSGNDPVDRLPEGRDRPRATGRTQGGLNSRLDMPGEGKGRPPDVFLPPGERADGRHALVPLRHLPTARPLPGDKAHDADRLRDGLRERGIRPCLPPRKKRKKPASCNKRLSRKRYRIVHRRLAAA